MWIKDKMEKEINGKKYQIKEVSYLQGIEIEETKQNEGIKSAAKKFFKFSTELSDEEIENLSMKDGLALQKAMNEINDLDFQEPVKE